MNAVADIAGCDAEPLDETVGRAEARLRALGRATEVELIVLDVVETLALALREASGAAGGDVAQTLKLVAGAKDLSTAQGKIARSIRQNALLEEKFEAALRDRKAGLEDARQARALKAARDEAAAARAVEAAAEAAIINREAYVYHVMEATIGRAHRDDEDAVEQLSDDYLERLQEEYGDYEGYGERPVSETVRRLCEEFDLEPEWERWAKEPWAIEEALAGTPGSPYVVHGNAVSAEPPPATNGTGPPPPPPPPNSS